MKKMTTLLIAVGICLLTSCGVAQRFNQKAIRIEEGMTKTEVLRIMEREPNERTMFDGLDKWIYYSAYDIYNKNKTMVITFLDGRVIGISNKDNEGDPSSTPPPPPPHRMGR